MLKRTEQFEIRLLKKLNEILRTLRTVTRKGKVGFLAQPKIFSPPPLMQVGETP